MKANNFDTATLLPDVAGVMRIDGSRHPGDCRDLVSNVRIIEFMDWTETPNASFLWDRLYTDVIKPLNRQDLHFIFHLGDVANQLVYNIDEVLDIIGDYSHYGKVTLMLCSGEAGNLWDKLNGFDPGAGVTAAGSGITAVAGRGAAPTKEKGHFIFNTMTIDSLVILDWYGAMLFSREGQVVLPGNPSTGDDGLASARHRFSVGYQTGLLRQLDTLQCMTLGLAVLEEDQSLKNS